MDKHIYICRSHKESSFFQNIVADLNECLAPIVIYQNEEFDEEAMEDADIAEIELAALTKQCLGKRRIDNLEDLNNELEKWHTDRNTRQKGVNWQFTTDDARIKLKHLYPLVTF